MVAVSTAAARVGAVASRDVDSSLVIGSFEPSSPGVVGSKKAGRWLRSCVLKSGRGSKIVTLVSGRRRCRATIDRPIVPAPRTAMWWVYSGMADSCWGN
jgi:hypothetical protein